MALRLGCINSFLVHPGKNENEPQHVNGATVPLSGKLFDMLSRVFDAAEKECPHAISFSHDSNGRAANPCRDLIIQYLTSPSQATGKTLAERLRERTTKKSGMGLFFLLSGTDGSEHKIVVSRFPADSAIMADEGASGLTVQFLEKVFMKSATSYKAVVYRSKSLTGGFWRGRAVDKQINHDLLAISNYWIKDFLESDFLATSQQGTKRLATILIKAIKSSKDVAVKQEIIAATQLAKGLNGKATSIKAFCQKFRLSDEAREAVLKHCQNDAVKTEQFQFSKEEFDRQVAIRTVELSNGAMLSASAEDFDTVFEHSKVKGTSEERFITQGLIVDEKVKRIRSA